MGKGDVARLTCKVKQPEGIDITVGAPGAATVWYSRVPCQDGPDNFSGAALELDIAQFLLVTSEAAKTYSGGFVALKKIATGILDVPLLAYTAADKSWHAKDTNAGTIAVTLTYFTNDVVVPRGVALACDA